MIAVIRTDVYVASEVSVSSKLLYDKLYSDRESALKGIQSFRELLIFKFDDYYAKRYNCNYNDYVTIQEESTTNSYTFSIEAGTAESDVIIKLEIVEVKND